MRSRDEDKGRASLAALGTIAVIFFAGKLLVPKEGMPIVLGAAVVASLLVVNFVEQRMSLRQIADQLLAIGGVLLGATILWGAAMALVPALRPAEFQIVTALVALLVAIVGKQFVKRTPGTRKQEPSSDRATRDGNSVLDGARVQVLSVMRIDRPGLGEWIPPGAELRFASRPQVVVILAEFLHYEAEFTIRPTMQRRQPEWVPEILDVVPATEPEVGDSGIGHEDLESAMDYATAWHWSLRIGNAWRDCVVGTEEVVTGGANVRLRFAAPVGVERFRLTYSGEIPLAEFSVDGA